MHGVQIKEEASLSSPTSTNETERWISLFAIKPRIQKRKEKDKISNQTVMNSITLIARRASLVALRQKMPLTSCSKAAASQLTRLMFSTHYRRDFDRDVNYNDYEGNRFSKDFEEMKLATDSIEHSLEQLKETRARHLKIVEGGGIPVSNLNNLLETARYQEADLSNRLSILRENMVDAERAIFAIDAPDGSCDYEANMNRSEIKKIIDFAAEHEDIDKVLEDHQKDRWDRKQAMKLSAVDGPDGFSDDEMMIDQDAVDKIIDDAADNEDIAAIHRQHEEEEQALAESLKTFAVDGPDGWTDDEMLDGNEAVRKLIDFAAEHENAYTVLKEHQMDDSIRAASQKVGAVDAPDGISDDEVKVDMEAVENIIEFASEHEDVGEVTLRHERERRDYIARMKRINDEHDW